MATHNAAAFSAGDIIQLSDKGGAYATALIVPSSGSAGNVITYETYSGESPTIIGALPGLIIISSKSYLSINHLILNSQTTGASDKGIAISGTVSNISIANTTITMPSLGYLITSSGNSSNITIDNVIGSGAGSTRQPIYFYGASNSNITITNTVITDGAEINLQNVNGLTLQNVIHKNVTGRGLYINNGSGILTVDNFTASSTSSHGVDIESSNFSENSIVKNSSIISPGLTGFYVENISGLIFQSNDVTNSGNSGFYASSSNSLSFISNQVSGTRNNTTAFQILGGSYNISLFSNVITNSSSIGLWISGGSHDVTSTSDIVENSNGTGFWADGTAYNLIFDSSIARNNAGDGFGITDSVHDVTYNKCLSYGNGTKSSTSSGDGFTTHFTNYNIFVNDSISYNNTCSGFAMWGTPGTSGHIYNSIAYNNGGNWTSQGGVDENRANFAISVSDVNPTTGTTWDIKNSIGYNGYPREVMYNTFMPTFDYNFYLPIDNSKFVSPDYGNTDASWSTYHATNEAHSQNGDPLFTNPASANFTLLPLSPAIDAGTTTLYTTDYLGNPIYGTPDIGAYEFQPPYTMSPSGDQPATDANIRIYQDGQYRYLASTSTDNVADLTVTPEGGSFETYGSTETRPAWLDLAINTWDATKSFIASSTIADLAASFTVGDLVAGRPYAVSVDGATLETLTADDEGQISFDYSGPWSTHTFEIEEYALPTEPEADSSHVTSFGSRRQPQTAPAPVATTSTAPTIIPVASQATVQELEATLRLLLEQLIRILTEKISAREAGV